MSVPLAHCAPLPFFGFFLPPLQDHMRKAGDVCFAQVFKDGGGMMGIVDYTNEDDMKYAVSTVTQ